ncbi:MAG: VTT domain-containing protein [Nitrososphaerales archaeon]
MLSDSFLAVMNTLAMFMKDFVELYGIPGLFFVMVIQSLIPFFFPSDVVIVGAVIFGMEPVSIVIVSALGSTVGGVIAFSIARKGGKMIVRRFIGEKWMERLDKWFEKWGWSVVIFGRAAPFISSDAIAYAAGVTKMAYRVFFPLALIGALIRAVILVFLGQTITGFFAFG